MSLTYSSQIRKTVAALTLTAATSCLYFAQSHHEHDADDPFLPGPVRSASTVPGNGDVNPYGVAFIKNNFQTGSGPLQDGDVLVSNFNNNQNLQGTGTTIVRIPKSGAPTTFFQGTAPLGLSTALGTLQYGFIVVGNLPMADGTAATAQAGSLLVINNQGKLIQTITSPEINGPWDMALVDLGDRAVAFISNAISGSISRLDFEVNPKGLSLLSAKTIAFGYLHRPDPAALFDAPTGLVYDHRSDVLYVASTLDNAIFAVRDAADRQHDAGTGEIIYQDNVHLHGALAMAMAPNGHLLVSNNDVINADPNQPSEIVEFTTNGQFVKELSVDPNLGGSFGFAVNATGNTATFAAVDDNTASLLIWALNLN
jgi:hypothetical protein